MEVLEYMLTYCEFREMEFPDDDPFEYELLDGELMKKASPSLQHQHIAGNIYFHMRLFAEPRQLGEVLGRSARRIAGRHQRTSTKGKRQAKFSEIFIPIAIGIEKLV